MHLKKALKDISRLDCAAHIINTVVKSTLALTHVELRHAALRGSAAALAACKRVQVVARVVKKQDKCAKKTRLQDAIELPRPHLSSYGAMLSSVLSHKREVCFNFSDS